MGGGEVNGTYQLVKYTALVYPRPWGNVALASGSTPESDSGAKAGSVPWFGAGTDWGAGTAWGAGIACGAVLPPPLIPVGPGAKAA